MNTMIKLKTQAEGMVDLVARDFTAAGPGQKWVGDIYSCNTRQLVSKAFWAARTSSSPSGTMLPNRFTASATTACLCFASAAWPAIPMAPPVPFQCRHGLKLSACSGTIR